MNEETMLSFINATVERFDKKSDEVKSNLINLERDVEILKRLSKL